MTVSPKHRRPQDGARIRSLIRILAATLFFGPVAGCWAPLTSNGIPASSLPDHFRIPKRTAGAPLNLSMLTIDPPEDYYLSAGDLLANTVHGLHEDAKEEKPIEAQVMASGEVQLPLAGAVHVGGKNLLDAQVAIKDAYEDGYLKSPSINVALIAKSSVSVLVLGDVVSPGTHILPKYENDVGHALAAAGGLSEDAADTIEIHTHRSRHNMVHSTYAEANCVPMDIWAGSSYETEFSAAPIEEPFPSGVSRGDGHATAPGSIRKIALRGQLNGYVNPDDVVLQSGDVVVVPSRRHEVFFVVGRLSQTNTVRFTIGNRERELGVGFILPREREIDVVTAVAMAGYIDPIESPTTVTVHRTMPDGRPLLVTVDLIAARYDPRETILVEAGDIIYLNPDKEWYFRRLMDKILGDLILLPYGESFRN